MIKLSKFAIVTLILQTVLTLGFNWLFYIIYYRLNKYAFLSLNTDSNELGNFQLFFKHKCKFFSILSIVCYFLFLIILSLGIMLINDVDFFVIINFFFFDYLKNNLIYAIFIGMVIFVLLTFSYKILMKNVYFTIFKNHHAYFNNFSNYDLILFTILCLVTLGWYYILYLFTLGIIELYIYFINKFIYRERFYFSTFGIISLFLISFVSIILLYYLYIYHEFYNIITTYFILLFIINILLNYGLYELSMRIFLNKHFFLLKKNHDAVFRPYINHRIMVISYVIIIIAVLYSVIQINEIKPIKAFNYDKIAQVNKCLTYDYKVCYPSDLKLGNAKYRVWKTPIQINENYITHQKLITTMINPDKISDKDIEVNYLYSDIFYTSEGKLYSYQNAYMYVQTYYKLINDYYVPVFNIIKNLELISSVDNLSIHISILDNNVYIYDFINDRFTPYNRDYHNIDTTRLMMDDLNITITSENTNLYGYHINDEIARLNMHSDNIENLQYFVFYLDPFMFSEVILDLYQVFSPLSKEKQDHLTDIDLLKFRLINDIRNISYYNDRYYLYMGVVRSSENISKSYAFTDEQKLSKCDNYTCSDLPDKLLTDQIVIDNLNPESRVLYTDAYINNDSFRIADKKTITILQDGKGDFNGDIKISFTLKTIRQYFVEEYISEEIITVK